MSVLAFTVLNAVPATGLVAGLAAAMRLPLVAGRHDQVEPAARPAEFLRVVQPETLPLAA